LTLALAGCRTTPAFYIDSEGVYYRGEDGKNVTGFYDIDGGTYYFYGDGRRAGTEIITVEGDTYYLLDGVVQKGWQTVTTRGESAVYYFDGEGKALKGDYKINGAPYSFDGESGRLLTNAADVSAAPTPSSSALPTPSSPALPTTPEPSPTDTPQPPASPTAPPSPSPKAGNSAAVGELTGVEKLDSEVKKIIDEVCDAKKDGEYNSGELFDWMVEQLKYKYISVDLSDGYTDELVHDLAEYIVLNRRGSCEHQAALMCVFNTRLGYPSQVVKGEFLSDDGTQWVEHAWVISEIDGEYYHFDPLFGRNHTTSPRSHFMKKDKDFEKRHRWERADYPVCE
jgi:hypothetical protein